MTTPAPDHRRLFGGDPGGYDRARPDYPSRVFEIPDRAVWTPARRDNVGDRTG